jgi:hypothetical protein
MKLTHFIYCLTVLLGSPLLKADLLLRPNDRVAICGEGYASFVEESLLMSQPVAGLDIAQFGWSAGDLPGLLKRLDTDVLPFKPTVVLTYFGGDVDKYGQAQTDLVEALKKAGVRTIAIGSPRCVDSFAYQNDPAKAAAENKRLGELADIAKDVAAKEGVTYADVYGVSMASMLKLKALHGDSFVYDSERNSASLTIAYAFLKALDCTAPIGTITVDYTASTAEGSPGQNIISFKDNTLAVESIRQPYHFPGTSAGLPDPEPNLAGLPFSDVNRYVLIVKNLPTAETKVYWGGDENHDFSSDDLAKGVNLTSAMLNRVFAPQSEAVGGGVYLQQKQENDSGNALVQGKPDPQADAKREAALQVVRDRVKPMQHTFRFKPLARADAQPPGPIPIIVDTDIDGDVDDVGALALLNDFMDQGEARLIACIHNTTNAQLSSCAAIQAINTYYGHPNIPIGQAYGDPRPATMTSKLLPAPAGSYQHPAGPFGSNYTLQLHQQFDPTFPNDDKMPAGVDVYRKALASAADGTVVICSIGEMINLQDLILSQPDSVSDLSGLDLVRKKVRQLVIMANTVPQDLYVLNAWPTKIMWSTEIGNYAYTGASLINTPENNPVRVAYHGIMRQSWDPTAAWLAVRGPGALWDVLPPGRPGYIERITKDPSTNHPNDTDTTVKMPGDQVTKLINDEMARPPKY